MDGFSKKYDHSFETEMYKGWEEAGCFRPESQKGTKGEFMIPMPPPNVTGVLHLGHALMLAVQDTMVRTARMKNKRTLWVPGTDHAGIATQVVVEKKLWESDKKTKDELGREPFMNKLWEWVNYSKGTIIGQTKRMGASCDRSREQFTMSEGLSRSVRKAFVKLYNEEKVYRDAYMVNWSPKAKTVLSDIEVEHREVEGKMYYIKYFVDGKGDCITIATVRPETMFADVAVAVHPKDKRYKKRIGRNVLIPIINKSIPVIADEEVDINLGTGALKITPTHSEVDYHIAWRHDLPMDNFSLDKEGNFTELAGEMFAGQPVAEFEENLIHHLKEIGNLDKVEDHTHSIPFCERTGCRVQPFLSTQWFMNVQPAAEKIVASLDADEVKVHPDRFKHSFMQWLEDIRPWCLSRQLRWGHRIPVWYDESGKKYAFDEDSVLESTKGKKSLLSRIVFNLVADSRLSNPFNIEQLIEILLSPSLVNQHDSVGHAYIDMYREKFSGKKMALKEIDEIQLLLDGVLGEFKQKKRMNDKIIAGAEKIVDILEKSANIVSTGDTYVFSFLPSSPETILTQDTDVLDTWFSSGLRPFSILGWPEDVKDFSKFYPNTVLETGYDIIFFWVIRMMIMGVEHTDKMPFEHVYLHGLVKDKHGKKMSKSKGNVIDPMDLVEKYGADAVRGSLLVGNTPGSDMKFDETRVEYMWKFINKIWNASRFVLHKAEGKTKKLDYEKLGTSLQKNTKNMNAYDRWIFSKTQDLIRQVNRYGDKFMIGEALQEIISVVRHDFCDRYIEISKFEKSDYTEKVLLYCLGTFYKLLHPSLPHVTEKLRNLVGYEGSLMMSHRPQDFEVSDKDYRMNLLMDMISSWRNLKRKVTNKPHEQVDIFVQANKDIQDLVQEHMGLVQDIVKVQNISYLSAGQEIEGDREIAMIMDIKVGLKGIKEINKKELLQDLELQLAQEQQFLQTLRNLFTGDFASRAPANVVEEKKLKMNEMKTKVANIEGEIRRLKMEVK